MADTLMAVENWEPVAAFRRSIWVYPAVSWLHLMGIGLLFGTIAIIDLRLIGLLHRLDLNEMRRTLVPLALMGFAVAVFSGLLLFAPAAREYLANPYFLAKLVLIAAAGFNALLLRVLLCDQWKERMVRGRIFGALSLALWAMVIFSGRMLAFG